MQKHPRQYGVTLVELIIVIMIAGIIAATLSVFIKPAMDSYTGTRSRSNMVDQADTAMRRMLRDVRRAVPNSLAVPVSNTCFALVPAVSGGRFRMGPDFANESCDPSQNGTGSCSAWVDTSQSTTAFDVLSTMSTAPSANDWVVINNQNSSDVYTGANTRQIQSVSTPTITQGTTRLTLSSGMQISPGYTGGRFQTISNAEQTVTYICSGTGTSNGNGTGTLYRMPGTFSATYSNAYPAACPSVGNAAVVLATNVASCNFVYVTNQGTNQQSGYLWMNIQITRNSETSKLVVGAHVMNVP